MNSETPPPAPAAAGSGARSRAGRGRGRTVCWPGGGRGALGDPAGAGGQGDQEEKKGSSTGQVANGVNTVHCSYATRGGHALIGARLYLPAEQLDDPDRRTALGIPTDVVFRTKPQLAIDIITDALADQTMPPWCAGDEVYGRSGHGRPRRLRGHRRRSSHPPPATGAAAHPARPATTPRSRADPTHRRRDQTPVQPDHPPPPARTPPPAVEHLETPPPSPRASCRTARKRRTWAGRHRVGGCGYWNRPTDDHLRSRRRHGSRSGRVAPTPRGSRPSARIDRWCTATTTAVPALAAAAAVTSTVRLTTAILISPYRGTVHCWPSSWPASTSSPAAGWWSASRSGGGTTTTSPPAPTSPRPRQAQDALLAEMRAVWAGESRGTAGAIGPAPVQPGGPPLLIGRRARAGDPAYDHARRGVDLRRRWPGDVRRRCRPVRAAWTAAGREGAPRLVVLGYYALGPDGPDAARRYLSDYYAFAGPYADQAAEAALTDPDAVRRAAGDVRRGGLRRADPLPVLARPRPGRSARRGRAALTPPQTGISGAVVLQTGRMVTKASVDAVLDKIDGSAAAEMDHFGTPGVAVSVVYDDVVLFSTGYGVREVGKTDPITPHTVFSLASMSKPISGPPWRISSPGASSPGPADPRPRARPALQRSPG